MWVEISVFSLLFGLFALYVFSISDAPLLYLFLPFIIWLAFRFSQGEVSKVVFIFTVAAVWGTAKQHGPMADEQLNSILPLSLFISIISITGLALSAALDERKRATSALQKMSDELELTVARRTMQLRQLIAALQEDILIRKKMQKSMLAKEKQLEEAQKLAHLGSWDWDVANDRLTISAEMARIYGVPDEQLPLTYNRYLDYIPPEERRIVHDVVNTALTSMRTFGYEHGVIRPDGTLRYLRCRGTVETDDSGTPIRLYGTAHDLTEERTLEKKLLEAEELYRKLVELSPDAIYLLDDGHCSFSNSAGLQLLAIRDAGQFAEKPFLDFFTFASRENIERSLTRLDHREYLKATEAQIQRTDGSVIDIELTAAAFDIKEKRAVLLVAHDISERKKAEQRIQHLAHYDVLTGLSNRLLFKERLEHAIARAHRGSQSLVVLFIDLDGFKNVNDTAGHNAGDHVLRECAQRLQSCLRESDTIARAGGDEFLVLIESYEDKRQISAVAQKILTAMKRPFRVDSKEFEIGASIGISTYPTDGSDVETLIKQADIAMYRVKTERKNNFCYYSPAMAQHRLERYAMESALRHALENHEMELYYQPKVSLSDGRICGAEALIRWNHPQYGMLLPGRFISLAEETGVITELGMWAIRQACENCRMWQQLGTAPVRIAINLAYPQFSDENLFTEVKDLLKEMNLEPESLEFEITETMVMENAESLMNSLQRIKEFGVHLSIDDFGTGYSSLSYLKRLPVDSVKVDRSFIKDLPDNSEDVAITHAILALVHSLKMQVIAEGVETKEQLQFLVRNGCDAVQGFYFSPALPARDFQKLIADQTTYAV